MSSDVLVIGGGVIGLSVVRELHKMGVGKITLIEKSLTGLESSWAAGGMLGPQAEADEADAFFDLCVHSREMYPVFASELLDETGIDIELDTNGTLYLAFTDDDSRDLHTRYEWQKRHGLEVELLSPEDARKAEAFISPDVREALFFSKDWQIDNRKLLAALRRYADLNAVEIIENTTVERLIFRNGKIVGVMTKGGEFRADNTILATGAWTSLIKFGEADLPVKISPVRGQMVMYQTAKRLFQHVVYGRRGYIVPRADGRILAGSTSENVGFEKAVTEVATSRLRQMALEIAPGLGNLAVVDSWSGLRPMADDSLPVIGNITGIDGLTIATAHYRNGILLAPLTAHLVAEKLVNGRENAAFTTFGPDRLGFASAG